MDECKPLGAGHPLVPRGWAIHGHVHRGRSGGHVLGGGVTQILLATSSNAFRMLRFFSETASCDGRQYLTGHMTGHISSQHILNLRALSLMASYDVACDVCPARSGGQHHSDRRVRLDDQPDVAEQRGGAIPRVHHGGRGLHSSTCRLNLSTCCGIRWVHDVPPVY